jgi:hypothetical protein
LGRQKSALREIMRYVLMVISAVKGKTKVPWWEAGLGRPVHAQ